LNKRTVVDAEEISLEELGLQVRSFNCLKRSGIDNLQQLMAVDDEDLKRVRNLGTKSYKEIKEKIDGYEEGINIDGSITIEYEQNNEKTVYNKIIFCNDKKWKKYF
jgi:DNA-directed RNA polymerase alpha subunit